MKTTPCTEKKQYAFENAPRCLAKTRQGTLCQSPAVKEKPRCRLHGCGKGSGAPKGNRYAVTHGHTTVEAKTFRQDVLRVFREARDMKKEVG